MHDKQTRARLKESGDRDGHYDLPNSIEGSNE